MKAKKRLANVMERRREASREALRKAIEAAGSQQALAASLGVTQQAVSKWLHRGWVPLDRACEIEAMYGVPRTATADPRVVDALTPVAAC